MLQISDLFVPFTYVTLHLQENDPIEDYEIITWTYSIIQIKGNHYHTFCFENGEFRLIHISPLNNKIKCQTTKRNFNFMIPG